MLAQNSDWGKYDAVNSLHDKLDICRCDNISQDTTAIGGIKVVDVVSNKSAPDKIVS